MCTSESSGFRVFGGGGVPLSIAPPAPDKSISVARAETTNSSLATAIPNHRIRRRVSPKTSAASARLPAFSTTFAEFSPFRPGSRSAHCTVTLPYTRARRFAQSSVEKDEHRRPKYCPQPGTYSSHPEPAPSVMDGTHSGSAPNGTQATQPYRFPSERMQRVLVILKFL